MSDRAIEIAQKQLQGQHPKSFLFINPVTGQNYTTNALGKLWRKHVKTEIKPYWATRHSFATQLIQSNDVTPVSAALGHSSVRTTGKYIHMKMTKLREAVNRRKVVGVGEGSRTLSPQDHSLML